MKNMEDKIKLLKELKEILSAESITDCDCISIYSVINLIYSTYQKLERVEKRYENELNKRLKKNGSSFYVEKCWFDYEDYELMIHVLDDAIREIVFSKINNDLKIVECHTEMSMYLLKICGDILLKIFDFYDSLSDMENVELMEMKSVNSNFGVVIDKYYVKISEFDKIKYVYDFIFKYIVENNEYKWNYNSNDVMSVIRGNELEILKRIFVKIDQCPKWMRDDLYEIRKRQLQSPFRRGIGDVKKLVLKFNNKDLF